MGTLTFEEQRRRDVAEKSDARMKVLQWLNKAENDETHSAAVAEMLERRRLTAEAEARRQRIAEYDRRLAEKAAAARKAKAAQGTGRQRFESFVPAAPGLSGGGRIERRAFAADGTLMSGPIPGTVSSGRGELR